MRMGITSFETLNWMIYSVSVRKHTKFRLGEMGMDEKVVVIKKNSVGSFLQGIVLGGALALLLAPRSGRETREIITERGYEFRDKATEIAKDTRSRAEHVLHDARNKVDESVKSVKEGVRENTTESRKQLKRELDIMEDINNPEHPL